MFCFSLHESDLLSLLCPDGPWHPWTALQCLLPCLGPHSSLSLGGATWWLPDCPEVGLPLPLPLPLGGSTTPAPASRCCSHTCSSFLVTIIPPASCGRGRPEAPQQGGVCGFRPQYDSPFRPSSLLGTALHRTLMAPSAHAQTPPLKHHNSFFMLPLCHPAGKQVYVYVHSYKYTIGTGMSPGACHHHCGPGGQGGAAGSLIRGSSPYPPEWHAASSRPDR